MSLFDIPPIMKYNSHSLREFITRANKYLQSSKEVVSVEESYNLILPTYYNTAKVGLWNSKGF